MTIERDLMWLSGLLEGEGYFSVNHSNGLGRPPTIRVGVTLTDLDVIERAAVIMGALVRERTKERRPCKQQYQFVVTGNWAVQWLEALKPLMGKRRQGQIENCLRAMRSFEQQRRQGRTFGGQPVLEVA